MFVLMCCISIRTHLITKPNLISYTMLVYKMQIQMKRTLINKLRKCPCKWPLFIFNLRFIIIALSCDNFKLKKNWYKRHKEQWLMKTENKIHDVFILYNQKNSQFWWWGNSMEAKFISHHKANDDFFVTYWNPVLQKDNSPSKRRTWSKGV